MVGLESPSDLGKNQEERLMNEIFEEARKRNVVRRFCDGRTLTQEEITFCQNHGLIFVNGDADWSLTEYGLHYLPASQDGDSSQCPDDDSYLPSKQVLSPTSALDKQEGGNHYKGCTIQPIEYIHANKLGYIEGNVVKYITRHTSKGGAEDVRKVIHYCELLLQLQYGEKA